MIVIKNKRINRSFETTHRNLSAGIIPIENIQRDGGMPKPQLKRSIGLFALTFYGLGTILGAGIYVLIGKIAGISGVFSPLVFLLAASIALFSAFSFAELAATFPKSAGEAFYVDQAFKLRWLSQWVGWGVVLTGIVSAATLCSGFVGYASSFIDLPTWSGKILILLLLGTITIIGIKPSVATAVIITIIEIGGLIWVITSNSDPMITNLNHWAQQVADFSFSKQASPILLGTFVAFYAFIGFEDIVNIAEEVKHPEKTLPAAIFLSIGIASILYFMVSITAVTALPIDTLAISKAPLADLVATQGKNSILLMSLIGMIAVINGALVQIIMASRVIYGMSTMQSAHKLFSYIHPVTQTPIPSIMFIVLIILAFTLWLPLLTLAKITSFLILIIFLLVNLSLLKLKLDHRLTKTTIRLPAWMPAASALLCLLLLLSQLPLA